MKNLNIRIDIVSQKKKGNKTVISIIKPTVTSEMIINSEPRPIEEMEIKSVIKNDNHRDILDNLFKVYISLN